MHNTSIFKEGIEQIEDGDHTALENAGHLEAGRCDDG